MFCRNCGKEYPDDQAFCPYCYSVSPNAQNNGNVPPETERQQGAYGYQAPNGYAGPGQNQQVYNQQYYPQQGYGMPGYNAAYTNQTDVNKGHPMKWHNFLTKFWLWFSAIGCISSISSMFVKKSPFDIKDEEFNALVKRLFSDSRGLKIAVGIIAAVLCVAYVCSALMLRARKKIGPIALYATLGLEAVRSFLSALISQSAVKIILRSAAFQELDVRIDTSTVSTVSTSLIITSAAISVLYIVLNFIYYNKRKDVFVN